jgi:hypothetical protein
MSPELSQVPYHPPDSPHQHIEDPRGLTLQVDFAWSKFRNVVSEKSPSGTLTPLYIQHFCATKPNLRIDDAGTNTQIATGTIHAIKISSTATVNGHTILIKPLKRWKTQYNYLSPALSSDPSNPTAPVSWITNVSAKHWDFICLDANQIAIAKFSVNWWALKEVGNFHFEKNKAELSKGLRDEVVTAGLTILYVMMTRMNNPLNLLGSVFAKPERVGREEEVEMERKKVK